MEVENHLFVEENCLPRGHFPLPCEFQRVYLKHLPESLESDRADHSRPFFLRSRPPRDHDADAVVCVELASLRAVARWVILGERDEGGMNLTCVGRPRCLKGIGSDAT